MPEKSVSARFQASFLMDNILSEKRLLADLNLNLNHAKSECRRSCAFTTLAA